MKAMKKVFAMLLALAMIVTAVPVSSASAATYNMKAGSAGIITKTLYAGRSHTLKLNGYKASQIKSTTWSVGKTTVVKLASKTKTTAKMTCVGKGYTVVTAKMTLTNKKVKTFKAKITIKNPSVSAEAAEVAVGKTTQLTVVAKPTNAKLAYASDNTDVATVSDQGIVTGVKEGTANVTVTLTCGTKKAKATAVVTVKEAAAEQTSLVMTGLVAKAADKLEATFAGTVNTDDVDFTLMRGTTKVEIQKTEWNEAKTVATLQTSARMSNGTYVLTAASKADATLKTSQEVLIEDQKAAQIVILNDIALTGTSTRVAGYTPGSSNSGYAYVYYDVLDQYGESMRNSVSIEWSSSATLVRKNASSGMLIFRRADDKEFTYGEQLFVTGVYMKTGLNAQKTLTIGAKQAVNAVSIPKDGAFIKKGTTTRLTALPADFKSAQYYMLFNVTDQNGNPLEAGNLDVDATTREIKDITFVSGNHLIISEIRTAGQAVTIDNHDYDTVLVTPGIKVEDGGEVMIEAIANKTGYKSQLPVMVNMSSVIKSFVMNTAITIADGDKEEIPFVATTEDGHKVTNFLTIAKQKTFNAIQFATSAGRLQLEEQDDGTAKLFYYDDNIGWDNPQSTDDLERMVSLTAIVIGGDTDNEMLSIRDKRRPAGVKNVKFHSSYVEGDEAVVTLRNNDVNNGDAVITYVDQYGEEIRDWAHGRGSATDYANEFFAASKDGQLSGNDFSGYVFGVMVTYSGNGDSTLWSNVVTTTNPGAWNGSTVVTVPTGAGIAADINQDAKADVFLTMDYSWKTVSGSKVIDKNDATGQDGTIKQIEFNLAHITMSTTIDGVATGEQYKFTVAKVKSGQYTNVDREKSFGFNVLDITKVQNITAANIDKIYVNTPNSFEDYMTSTTANAITGGAVYALTIDGDHARKVKVTGSYGGKNDVTIPVGLGYLQAAGDYVKMNGSTVFDSYGLNIPVYTINTVVPAKKNELYAKFYTKAGSSENFVRQDVSDVVTIDVMNVYTTTGAPVAVRTAVASVKKSVILSDAAPEGVELVANAASSTNHPTQTGLGSISGTVNDNGWQGFFTLKDQYGVDVTGWKWNETTLYGNPNPHYGAIKNPGVLVFTVGDIKEADGYADNNFSVTGNSSESGSITGAERGDTFTVTATYKALSATINVTVGADKNSKIVNSTNTYLETLVGDGTVAQSLEGQRQASLK